MMGMLVEDHGPAVSGKHRISENLLAEESPMGRMES